MRVKTELSEKPPVYTVVQEGTEAVITFYTDVVEAERDGEAVWEAVEWTEKRPWADNLPERIAADPDLWRSNIQYVTEEEERKAEEAMREAAIAEDLPDLVLDLDFRLTLMEEFGY